MKLLAFEAMLPDPQRRNDLLVQGDDGRGNWEKMNEDGQRPLVLVGVNMVDGQTTTHILSFITCIAHKEVVLCMWGTALPLEVDDALLVGKMTFCKCQNDLDVNFEICSL